MSVCIQLDIQFGLQLYVQLRHRTDFQRDLRSYGQIDVHPGFQAAFQLEARGTSLT